MEIGKYIKQYRGYKSFIPERFPPKDLSFLEKREVASLLSRADVLVGKLDGLTKLVPDIDFFIFMYVRKEATLSSQIEGTKAKLTDALQAEIEKMPDLPEDVDDILHYIRAMNTGLKKLEKLPLSLRLIKVGHKELLTQARSSHDPKPGEFRQDQNWINGTSPFDAKYVPPPPHMLNELMGDLEEFFYSHEDIPVLIKAGLIHPQFETIHPFRDGNGRVGRLLITFYLCQQKLLERPVLYLSDFLKKHREVYFKRIDAYQKGDIESWITFFLKGIIDVTQEAIDTSDRIVTLRKRDMQIISSLSQKTSKGAIKVLKELYKIPIINARRVHEVSGFSRQGSYNLIDTFVEEGILVQRGEKEYGKSYVYQEYLNLFESRD